jgi:acyl-CoA thioesterase
MGNMKEFFNRDAFARHLGMELLEVGDGRAVTRMDVRAEHCNCHGTAHGGVIFALADFAFEAACNSHGTVAVAINVNISFVKAAGPGPLRAEAVESSRNAKLGTYDIRVIDPAGDLVASFQGMAYRKKDPIEWPEGQDNREC